MWITLITIASGEECEGNAFGLFVCLAVCLWVCVCVSVRTNNSKAIAPIYLIFCTRSIIPMARSSSKMIRIILVHIWTQEFVKGLFTIENFDKICHQRMPRRQTCAVVKTLWRRICVITSKGLSSPIAFLLPTCGKMEDAACWTLSYPTREDSEFF